MMSTTKDELFVDEKYVIHRIKFIVFLIFQIPSIIISIFLFVYLSTHRHVISIRPNQGLFILLLIHFCQLTIDMSMDIHFNRLGYVNPSSPIYCTWWTFFEFSLIVQSEMLMSVISIQRHIFVFQPNLFNSRLYRYLYHHIPLFVFVVYPIVFYLISIIFYPCDGTQWDYQANVCGLADCYLVYDKILATLDWSLNNGLPIIVISLANVTLIYRVIRRKRRVNGNIPWRKQRRMTIQLLSISCLYFFGWLPSLTIGLIQQLYSSTFLSDFQVTYAFDLMYFICLLLPWIYFRLYPQFNQWFIQILFKRFTNTNTVRPINVTFLQSHLH